MNLVKIIFVFVAVTLSHRADGEPLTKRCELLKSGPLKRICTGTYPLETKIKYRDEFIGVGETFSVYQFANEANHYFLTFKAGDLNSCDEITSVGDANTFTCKASGATKKFDVNGFVRCIAVHLHMVDELVQLCKKENGDDKFKVDASVYVALHYHNARLSESINGRSDRFRAPPMPVLLGLLLIVAGLL